MMRKILLLLSILLLSLPLKAQDDMMMSPGVQVSNQVSLNGSVVIDSAYSAGPGFIVIHADNGSGGPGPVIGHQQLISGINYNVKVAIDVAQATPTLYAMLHLDTGAVGVYEFQQVEGADGPAQDAAGNVITPAFSVDLIDAKDQMLENNAVTIATVVAQVDGWLVVHQINEQGGPGPVAGFAPVSAGRNSDVIVTLDQTLVTARLFPMLHIDSGEAGVYEFQQVEGADGPVRDTSGNVIVFGIDAAPSISYEGELRDNGLFVTQALIDTTGWLVIHSGAEGSPGPVLGHWPLRPGLNANIVVPLDPAEAGALVFPMLHVDTGEAGVYEFQQVEGADAPVRVNGNVVVGPMALAPTEPLAAEDAASEQMAACEISSGNTVNQRQGPGTNFGIAGSLNAGTTLTATGQAQGADGFVWWNLADGTWVRSDVVNASGDCAALPVVEASSAPAAPAAPAQPSAPAATEEVS